MNSAVWAVVRRLTFHVHERQAARLVQRRSTMSLTAVRSRLAGGGLAIAAVGIDVTVSAVKIAAGGGSIKILSEIRSHEWKCCTKSKGVLS